MASQCSAKLIGGLVLVIASRPAFCFNGSGFRTSAVSSQQLKNIRAKGVGLEDFFTVGKKQIPSPLQFYKSVGHDIGDESEQQPKSNLKDQIWSLIKPQRKNIFLSSLLGLSASCVSVMFPFAFGKVLQALLKPVIQMKEIYKAMSTMAVLYALEPILTYFYVRQMTLVNNGIVSRLKLSTFKSILAQDISYFDEKSLGEITGIINVEINGIKTILGSNLSKDRGLRSFSEVLLGAVVLGVMNWRLGLVFGSVIPAAALFCVRFRQLFFMFAGAEAESMTKESTGISEVVRNIREVRSFGTEDRTNRKYQRNVHQTSEKSVSLGKAAGKLEAYNRAGIYISIFSVVLVGAKMAAMGLVDAGFLVPFIGFCFSMNFAIQGLYLTQADAKRCAGHLDRVSSALASAAAAAAPGPAGTETIPPGELRGRVELRGVGFAYPTRPDIPVFEGLDLAVPAGKVTALVGQSGAGKSTITALLSGFYQPSAGAVTLDGRDLRALDPRWRARQVALVGQSPALFAGSVAANIAYGGGPGGDGGGGGGDREAGAGEEEEEEDELNGATLAQVEAAAREANAHDFIMSFPDGYATKVGEGGVQLSGGQRQRVAIARALLKDAPVLVLDEATSALDAESEALVQQALERLMAGRTVLVVAHRLSTVVNADKIVVLKGGQVLEEGTHTELMERGEKGAYWQLMRTQTQGLVAGRTSPLTPQEEYVLS